MSPEMIKLVRFKQGSAFRMVEKGAPAVHPCLANEIGDGSRRFCHGKERNC